MRLATLLACFFALALTPAYSATVTYKLLVDGQENPTLPLAVGTHTLSVEAMVSDNYLSGLGVHGGLLMSFFDLRASSSIQFENLQGGLFGGPDTNWDSTSLAFPSSHPGALKNGGSTANEIVGGFQNWGANVTTIGANSSTSIVQGNFFFDGTTGPTISLDGQKYLSHTRIASADSKRNYGRAPEAVTDDCIFGCTPWSPPLKDPPSTRLPRPDGAPELAYRMAIDGDYREVQPYLSPGTHTLTVEAIVTGNPVAGVNGGLIQSSFDLSTNNGGFTFVDNTGGFLGAPNKTWDSSPLINPFDVHFQGSTALGGGPTVEEETHAINPANFNDRFQDVGANAYSIVAQGDFVYAGGPHPDSLNLTSSININLVSAFNGGNQIVTQYPDFVSGMTITFADIAESPSTLNIGAESTSAMPNQTLTHQFVAADGEEPAAAVEEWSILSFAGPSEPDNFSLDPTTGVLSWDTTGVRAGLGQVYTLVVSATDAEGTSGVGALTISVVPEPSSLALWSLAFVAIALRRRAAQPAIM